MPPTQPTAKLCSLPHSARLKQGVELAKQLEQILDRDTRFDVGDFLADPQASSAANREPVGSFRDSGQW